VIAGSALAAPALRRISARRVLAAGLGLVALADAGLAVSGLAIGGLGGGGLGGGGVGGGGVGTGAAERGVAVATWALPGCVAVAGAGLGLASVAATTRGTAVPEALRGAASGVVNTAAQLGTAIGIAVLLLVAAATTGAPGVRAPVIAWATAAAIGAAGAFAFTRRPGQAECAAGAPGGERAGADHADGADRTDEASRTRAGPARVLVRAGPGSDARHRLCPGGGHGPAPGLTQQVDAGEHGPEQEKKQRGDRFGAKDGAVDHEGDGADRGTCG
jgi:hypothetical protein